jgi:polyhydroxyalkanoate synthesis regulator phasin
MPKKKNPETQEQQSERFRKVVRELVDAGELNPTEADKAFEQALANSSLRHSKNQSVED